MEQCCQPPIISAIYICLLSQPTKASADRTAIQILPFADLQYYTSAALILPAPHHRISVTQTANPKNPRTIQTNQPTNRHSPGIPGPGSPSAAGEYHTYIARTAPARTQCLQRSQNKQKPPLLPHPCRARLARPPRRRRPQKPKSKPRFATPTLATLKAAALIRQVR
ncbi:uncharacterized protein J3D65DRAFT_273452 [Phyllosticta citribraziliensis]|uniref:Uncharacterized protein n=1 Tax=Phyllosticta citribraziliensis TaxID=989973 RepID=A0ABR1M4J3_9PEZI